MDAMLTYCLDGAAVRAVYEREAAAQTGDPHRSPAVE